MGARDKQKELAYAEIMHMFRYFYKDEWAPGNLFEGKSRTWNQAFNEMVKHGHIKKKKEYPGYRYRWTGVFPNNL